MAEGTRVEDALRESERHLARAHERLRAAKEAARLGIHDLDVAARSRGGASAWTLERVFGLFPKLRELVDRLAAEIGYRLTGSSDLFKLSGRRPTAWRQDSRLASRRPLPGEGTSSSGRTGRMP